MRISLVGPTYPYRGGIARFMTSLCQELVAVGHDVQTISFRRQYPAWLYPGQSDKDPSLQGKQIPAFYILDPLYPWTWRNAVCQIADFQPNLVIIQWWNTFWAPAFFFLARALKRRGILCLFCIHNVFPHENRLPDIWMARSVLSQANAFITLSPKESGRLQKLIPTAKIYQSRLPVPKNQSMVINRTSSRQALNVPDESQVLFFFGIVRPYKGLRLLIDALSVLKSQAIQPLLFVVGEFWEDVGKYQRQIERLSLEKQVFLENRYLPDEELPRFFYSADAFVAPYTNGTQSAAIKTAMSYGLPILASDQIASDLPLDSYPVRIHHAGDVEDLARSIRLFFEQNQPGSRANPTMNGWEDLVALVQTISNDLSDHVEKHSSTGRQ